MRFRVSVDAVAGHKNNVVVHLGTTVVTVKADDYAKAAAESAALEALWDNRLDCTCSPRIYLEALPRYLVANDWEHYFENGEARDVRFVYDYETARLAHLQISHPVEGWTPTSEAQRLEVELAIKSPEEGALDNPESWGCNIQDELPGWAT